MKLRVRDNSIRLRLTKPEVDSVYKTGLARGRVNFPGGHAFEYLFESSPATVKPEAHMSNNVLTVRAPRMDVQQWAESERVSIKSEQELGNGDQLKILIEKDFACLAPRDEEDDADMYANPGASQ